MESEYGNPDVFSFSDAGLVFIGKNSLFYWDKNTTQVIAQVGQTLDAYPGCTLSFYTTGYSNSKFSQPHINNVGEIIFGVGFIKSNQTPWLYALHKLYCVGARVNGLRLLTVRSLYLIYRDTTFGLARDF